MRFSIIVPCYNVEESIFRRCIKSILAQSWKDFEVIVVDDGSKQEYANGLSRGCKLDNRIRLYTQKNRGVSVARNLGVKKAKGDYIVFVDADDVLVSYFLEEAKTILDETKAEFLIGGNCLFHNHRFNEIKERTKKAEFHKLTRTEAEDFKANIVGEVKHFDDGIGYFGRGPWTRCIKRNIAEIVQFSEKLKMGEDIVWNLDMLDYCNCIVTVPRIWYRYYINGSSANHQSNDQMLSNVELELPEIISRLDLKNMVHRNALAIHILDEIEKIYYCYLGNEECNLQHVEKQEIKRKLYCEFPWTKVKLLSTTRVGIYSVFRKRLYCARMLFPFLYIKGRIKKLVQGEKNK